MTRSITTLGLAALAALLIYALLLWGIARRPPILSAHSWVRVALVLGGWAAVGLLTLLAALIVPVLLPQSSGPLALVQVFAPYLALPALLVVPLAFVTRRRWLWLLLGLCLGAALLRSPPSLGRLIVPHGQAAQLTVFHWNVAIDGPERQQGRLRPVLAARPGDVVVLPETYWDWMRSDPTIARLYPYQLVHTEQASSGLVLLSAFPFLEADVARNPPGTEGWPRLLWARLDLGGGETVLVVAAHPESPYSSNSDCRILVCYDTAERDSLTPRVRAVIDPALERGERVLLVGDLNTTSREPGYAELSRGLRDVHHAAGLGWGHSWGVHSEPRSSDAPVEDGVLPLLRIDYMFASSGLVPLVSDVDCGVAGSDHCALRGAFALDEP